MRTQRFALAALVAAVAIIPTVSSTPVSAQNWFQRAINSVIGPTYPTYPTYPVYSTNTTYPYGYANPYDPYIYNSTTYRAVYPSTTTIVDPLITRAPSGPNMNVLVSTGQISQAQHQAWVDSINARVARGELTLSQGNLILTRGYE